MIVKESEVVTRWFFVEDCNEFVVAEISEDVEEGNFFINVEFSSKL